MYTESYKQIKTNIYTCIKPKSSFTLTFNGDEVIGADRLFITGETNVSPYWKTEPDYQMLYRRIDDSLRSDVSHSDRFCLDLSGRRANYPKIAFRKLMTPFHTPMFELNDCTDRWTLGISARAAGLKIYGHHPLFPPDTFPKPERLSMRSTDHPALSALHQDVYPFRPLQHPTCRPLRQTPEMLPG